MKHDRIQRASFPPRGCAVGAAFLVATLALTQTPAMARDRGAIFGGIAGGIAAGIIASQMMQQAPPGVVYVAPRKKHAKRPRTDAQRAAGTEAQKQAAGDPFAGVTPTMNTRVRTPAP